MSNLPVSSRLKAPASRILKTPGTTKSEGIPVPRSGIGSTGGNTSSETPQRRTLREPLSKRSSIGEPEKLEKRGGLPAPGGGSNITTPRNKQGGSQTKLNKIGLGGRPPQTPVGKRESGLSTNLKSQLSGSLSKEPDRPALTREKTQESLKDVETGILFKVGDRVLVGDSKAGVIEYLGETKFAKGYWAGVKLDEPTGKNDGCVAGVRYFDCEPLHGVFSKANRLHKINIVPSSKKNSISELNYKLEESSVLKIGDHVLVSGTKLGILRYLGPTEFSKGEWAGVELQEPLGKNDGAVAGTRYFSCEMKYGLFAPAAKIVKSKKQPLSRKPSIFSPETSLASAAKSVFNRTVSLSSDTVDVYAAASSPSEKPSVAAVNLSASPIESLHQALKKTPSSSQQVAALQSALEEREREIRKMLMERELEKAEKLKELDETTKGDVSYKQALKEKDDIIQSLKDDVDKSKKEVSTTQTKLDEGKKKYEDLQFMLEEEKITDDELKNHVKEDESKIKELADETREKNEKIISLQKELRDALSGNLGNEAKILELRDELNESKTKHAQLKSNAATITDTAQPDTQQVETLLASAQKELDKSREEVRQKSEQINELEIKVNAQMKQQNEVEDQGKRDTEEKLTTAEAEKRSAIEECQRIKLEKDQVVGELSKLQNEKNELQLQHATTTEKLQALEKQHQDLTDINTMLTAKKGQAIKANNLSLNAKILDLETQLSESHNKISHLEDSMATSADTAQQKTQELQTLLSSANKELDEHKEVVNKKTMLVADMESKLHAQIVRQKEIEKEVESLDQADQHLALIKEAHRTEVETLQSKVKSMAEAVTDMEKKHGDVVESHKSEMVTFQTSKDEEIKNMKEKIRAVDTEKSNTFQECERLRVEKGNVLEELSKLHADHNEVQLSKSATSDRLQELEKKCQDLSVANTQLSSERDDTIQLCEEQDQQLDTLKKERDSLSLEKDLFGKEKDELSGKIVSLETKINNLYSESSTKQGELREVKESEIQNIKAQLEEALKDKKMANDTVSVLNDEQKTLQIDLEAQVNEVNRLQSEQLKIHFMSQELQNEISDSKKIMLKDNESSRQTIETLNSKIAILKDDLEESKNSLKQKEEEIRFCKEQIDRMGSEGIPKSPMDGDILENASTLLIRLHEAESKMSTLQSEKETTEEQTEFLNSVIVGLQNKYEKAKQTIALLEAGDESILIHGLDSESDEELVIKPQYSMRIFCDICDVFDKHETDECPLQEGDGDTGGVKNSGERNHERPYCSICEAFGHWTENCDDEMTF